MQTPFELEGRLPIRAVSVSAARHLFLKPPARDADHGERQGLQSLDRNRQIANLADTISSTADQIDGTLDLHQLPALQGGQLRVELDLCAVVGGVGLISGI